jgi:hypothetical protein
VLLVLVAAMAALAAAAGAVWSRRASDPAWAARWRHAGSEVGYRAGAAWAEFRDWLRSA